MSMHVVNFPIKHAPILCKRSAVALPERSAVALLVRSALALPVEAHGKFTRKRQKEKITKKVWFYQGWALQMGAGLEKNTQ